MDRCSFSSRAKPQKEEIRAANLSEEYVIQSAGMKHASPLPLYEKIRGLTRAASRFSESTDVPAEHLFPVY